MTTQGLEDLGHLGLVERLVLEQLASQLVEHVTILDERVVGLLVRGLQQLADLFIDPGSGDVGVVTPPTTAHAHEGLRVAGAELDRAERLGHAVLRDHRAGDLGGLLDVIAGAGGRIVEDHLLGGAATEHVGHLVEQLPTGLRVLVLVGHDHRVAQRATARQDRDLLHGVVAGHRGGDQRVATLVVGGDQQLVVVHQTGLLLRAGDDTVDRLAQLVVADHGKVETSGQQGGLVEDVGQVGTGEARGATGDRVEVDVGGHRLALGVHAQDLGAALQIGGPDAAAPDQGRRDGSSRR